MCCYMVAREGGSAALPRVNSWMVFEIFSIFFFFLIFVLKVKNLFFFVSLWLFSLRRCLRVPLGDFESEKER